jgi:hypothetical protein
MQEKKHDKYERQLSSLGLEIIIAQLDHKINVYNEQKQGFLEKLKRVNGKKASE